MENKLIKFLARGLSFAGENVSIKSQSTRRRIVKPRILPWFCRVPQSKFEANLIGFTNRQTYKYVYLQKFKVKR